MATAAEFYQQLSPQIQQWRNSGMGLEQMGTLLSNAVRSHNNVSGNESVSDQSSMQAFRTWTENPGNADQLTDQQRTSQNQHEILNAVDSGAGEGALSSGALAELEAARQRAQPPIADNGAVAAREDSGSQGLGGWFQREVVGPLEEPFTGEQAARDGRRETEAATAESREEFEDAQSRYENNTAATRFAGTRSLMDLLVGLDGARGEGYGLDTGGLSEIGGRGFIDNMSQAGQINPGGNLNAAMQGVNNIDPNHLGTRLAYARANRTDSATDLNNNLNAARSTGLRSINQQNAANESNLATNLNNARQTDLPTSIEGQFSDIRPSARGADRTMLTGVNPGSQQAGTDLSGMPGLGEVDIENDPTFRFLFDQSAREISNIQAAQGKNFSGGTLEELGDRHRALTLSRSAEIQGQQRANRGQLAGEQFALGDELSRNRGQQFSEMMSQSDINRANRNQQVNEGLNLGAFDLANRGQQFGEAQAQAGQAAGARGQQFGEGIAQNAAELANRGQSFGESITGAENQRANRGLLASEALGINSAQLGNRQQDLDLANTFYNQSLSNRGQQADIAFNQFGADQNARQQLVNEAYQGVNAQQGIRTQQFNEELAGNDLAFNQRNQNFNQLYNLAALGANATAGVGSAGMNTAAQVSNLLTNQANYNAASLSAPGNNLRSLITGLAPAAGAYYGARQG
jgi:hypothetical protein